MRKRTETPTSTFARLIGLGLLTLAAPAAWAVPTFVTTAPTTVNEDTTYTYNIDANDTQAGQIQITATVLPAWLTLPTQNAGQLNQGTATLSGTPTQAQVGVHAVTLLARNLTTNLTATQSFTITVANVNDAPTFTSTPVTSATQGQAYTYNITTADAENNPRTITATGLPAGIALVNVNAAAGTATLSGTPGQAAVGTHSITLRVTDTGTPPLFAQQTFTLTVANVNDPPSFTSTAVTTAAQNAVYTYSITTADPDTGGTRTIAATPGSPLPTWLSLTNVNPTAGTATLTGTPAQAQVGVPQQVSLRVTDNGTPALFATQAFTITVTDVNDPPRIRAPIPTQLATENTPFQLRNAAGAPTTLAAFFEDIDPGDTLTYQVTGLPPSGRLVANATTGAITGTPLQADARDTPYVVQVTANDGRSAPATLPTQTFNLTVAALDRADVGLTLAVAPSPALVNGNIDWTFTIANGGPQPSAATTLRAEFAGTPVAFTRLGTCTVAPAADRQVVTCSVPAIAAGATSGLVLAGNASQTGDISVSAEVVPPTAPVDPNTANNRAAVAVNVAQTVSTGAAQVLASGDNTGAATGDVNGDGFLDLAVTKSGGRGTEIYLNAVSPTNEAQRLLQSSPLVLDELTPSTDVVLADLDNDNDLDVVTTNATGQRNTVFANAGSGSFGARAALGTGNTQAAAAADFNGDGLRDLAFANAGANAVFLNGGSLAFTASDTFDTGNHVDVAVADFDLDTRPDIVFANLSGPSRFNRNLGGGQFADGIAIDTSGAQAVATGDFNRDGRPDVVLARASAAAIPPALAVFRNDPGSTASPAFTPMASLGAAPVADVLVGDADGDGNADIVAIGATGTHQLYRGDGSGGFVLHPVQFSSATPTSAALGKLSVDDRLDVAVAGSTNTSIFHNDGRAGFGVGDTDRPSIQMIGPSSVTLTVESAYQDGGATASDPTDGDITSRIVVGNPVNTAVVGTYTVTFDVTDRSGNAATRVTRSVRVAPREGTGGGGGGAVGAPLALLALLLYAALAGIRARKRGWE